MSTAPDTLRLADLETFYDDLAEAIDTAGEAKTPLFLAKLALQLASEVKDPAKLSAALAIALRDL